MTEHSPLISDEDTGELWAEYFPHQEFGLVKVDELGGYEKKLLEAQRDASDAYWKDRIADTFREFINKANDVCSHGGYINDEPVLHKHECSVCWQALTKEEG